MIDLSGLSDDDRGALVIVSSDTAVLVPMEDGTHDIVLITRGDGAEEGKEAMPGGRRKPEDETVTHAAQRELNEEMLLWLEIHRFRFFYILDGRNRDARPGARMSVVHLAIITEDEAAAIHPGDGARAIKRLHLRDVRKEQLAFDHHLAIEALRAAGYR